MVAVGYHASSHNLQSRCRHRKYDIDIRGSGAASTVNASR